MYEFDFPLDPAETMTVRRVVTPKRVPNKGRGVYRFDLFPLAILRRNGWEYLGDKKGTSGTERYYRSPDGVEADRFNLDIQVPTDAPILRLAAKFTAWCAGEGHFLRNCYDGHLGHWLVSFHPIGRRGWIVPLEEWEQGVTTYERCPTFSVHAGSTWSTHIYWPEGVEKPLVWDRSDYYSGIVPGVGRRPDMVEPDVETIFPLDQVAC